MPAKLLQIVGSTTLGADQIAMIGFLLNRLSLCDKIKQLTLAAQLPLL
jgi:hypothetical protein